MDVVSIIESRTDKVFFFSLEKCPYCVKLADELHNLKVPYEKVSLANDDTENKARIVEVTKHKTFPQLFIGKTFVGGYDAFIKLQMTNQLQTKLQEVGIVIEDCMDF